MLHISSNLTGTGTRKCPDAILSATVTELDRLDADLAKVLANCGGKDLEDLPQAAALNARRDEALTTLCEVEARTIIGVEAKAQALRTPDLITDYKRHGALAVSLAEDIARLAEERASLEREPPPGTMVTLEGGPGAPVAIWYGIRMEGKRLFKLATGEFDAQVAALRARGVAGAELDEQMQRLRRELRLDALFELTDDDIDAPSHAATPAAAPAGDAALVAYEPRLRALKAEMDARLAEANRIEAIFEAMLPARPVWGDPDYAAWAEIWNAAKRESGYDTAYDAFGATVEDRNELLREISAIPARTIDGLCLKVRYGEGYDPVNASIIADLIAIDRRQVAASLPVADGTTIASLDPVFAPAEAHRSAHIDWLATLKQPDQDARDAAMERKTAAFEALVATRPTTEGGRLAYATQVLFEFCHAGEQAPAKSWVREVGRQINGGLPITEESVPPMVIEPMAVHFPFPMAAE